MKKNVNFLLFITLMVIGFVSCKSKEHAPKDTLFSGYIENTQINVTTRIPGRITAIYVNEGDTIKQGEKVAQLDQREILANRAVSYGKVAEC